MSKQNQIQKINWSPVQDRMKAAGMNKEAIAKEVSFAAQIIHGDPYLQQCTVESKMAAVVNVANVGLTLNPAAQQAYLIARYNRKSQTYECTIMTGYRGFLYILVSSGGVKNIIANLVYEKDEFELEPTNEQRPVRHRPYLRRDKGELIGGYALATLPDNSRVVEWMPIEDINDIRDGSDAYRRGKEKGFPTPWTQNYSEMCRKTLIRRIQKYLPTTYSDRVNTAIELDNADYSASYNQLEYIDRLLPTSNIRPEEAEQIQRAIKEYGHYSKDEAEDIINMLLDNQIDTGRWNSAQLDSRIKESVEKDNS